MPERRTWGRPPSVALDLAGLTALVAPGFPGESVVEATPAEGGLANANLRLRLSRHPAPVLLRLFVRDPASAAKEIALCRTLAGRVPVPAVLHFATQNPVTGHAYALMEWIDGVRLEVAAPRLGADAVATLGRSVGSVLAGIHAVVFPRTGFLDASLKVATPVDVGSAGLVDFLRQCLVEGPGGARLGADLTAATLAFAGSEGRLLDAWRDRRALRTRTSAARTSSSARTRRAGPSPPSSTGSSPSAARHSSTSATCSAPRSAASRDSRRGWQPATSPQAAGCPRSGVA